jgi:DNA-binding MarR family transcriptional regulator
MVGSLRLAQLVRTTLAPTLREHDLTLTTYLIFVTLWFEQDRTLTLGSLSKRLMLHPTTVSLVIDKCIARQLTVRSPHPSDGRIILVSLTDKGEQTLQAVSRSLSKLNFGLIGASVETSRSLAENVREVLHTAEDH